MTQTQNPQVKVTKSDADYDGTPRYDVTVDGVRIGRVRKTVNRTPHYCGNTRIVSGYSQRTAWAAEGIGWKNPRGDRYTNYSTDRTKAAAVDGLDKVYLANKEA
jgi:hypothetical protein